MIEFKQFAERFNKNDNLKPFAQFEIDQLENEFQIILPTDYKVFLLTIGDAWTPDILDLVVDQNADIHDVQQFWSIERIIYDKQNEWTSQVATDIIPFASDCMGNIFSFLRQDLKLRNDTASVYFFDHDFDTVEKISDSFKEWINVFNSL
ncbi:MAG TPA: SMI1/KNR4 family protein [Puia sp.]|nr:SMI1/KNR4 family protein [Puia sp.]